jgi:phosphatidylinositol N-acetylglucosaminyltransferase subunit C
MREPWRRVLFERQNYPDNYIDPTQFLEKLFVDRGQAKLSFPILVVQTTVVILHYNLVVLFLVVYRGAYDHHEQDGDLSFSQMHWLVKIIASFLAGSLLVYVLLHAQNPTHDIVGTLLELVKKCCIAGIYLRLAAPILSVLTSSFSDDTIYALVICFSALHLVFFDYCYQKDLFQLTSDRTNQAVAAASSLDSAPARGNIGTSPYTINNVSLNAAMLTTILLASRLRNLSVVVLLIVFAIILFCVLPHVIRLIYLFSPALHLVCTLGMCVFTGYLLLAWHHDTVLFNIFMMILLFMWFICPTLLVYMSHSHKRNNRRIHTGDLC